MRGVCPVHQSFIHQVYLSPPLVLSRGPQSKPPQALRDECSVDRACRLPLPGLRERWKGVKSKLSSGVSFGHIKRHVPSFEVRGFPKDAQAIFVDFHEAYERVRSCMQNQGIR
jgi:hypothetical protein